MVIVLDSREWERTDEPWAKRFSEDDRIEAQKVFANNLVHLSPLSIFHFPFSIFHFPVRGGLQKVS
jgi:hypothetical protein